MSGPQPQPYLKPEYEEIVRALRAGRRKVKIPPSDLFRGELHEHQHTGVAVMYMVPRMILADVTGVGKTVQTLRYLTYLIEKGEVTFDSPAFVVAPAKALDLTWRKDGFETFTPGIPYAVLDGSASPQERRRVYATGRMLVYCLNYNVFWRDYKHLMERFPRRRVLVCDEAHGFRNHGTVTAKAVKEFGNGVARIVLLTASAINTELDDAHSLFEALGLTPIFGTRHDFQRRFYNTHVVQRRIPGGRTVYVREQDTLNPYKDLDEFKRLVWPWYLRRSLADLPPGSLPEIVFEPPVWVELTPQQEAVYEHIRRGGLPPPGPGRRFRLQARAQYLRQVSVGMQTLQPRAHDFSSKLDELMYRLQHEWVDGGYYLRGPRWVRGCPLKVVVYSTWKETIMTLTRRLTAANIGFAVIAGTGALPSGQPFPYGTKPNERGPIRDRFFRDPECRVLIGSGAIEMSVNLQAAPVLVNLDMLANPARMRQIAGRIQRANSPWSFVQVFSILARGTVEEGTLRLLQQRQSLIDYLHDEPDSFYTRLSEEDLEYLVTHRWRES